MLRREREPRFDAEEPKHRKPYKIFLPGGVIETGEAFSEQQAITQLRARYQSDGKPFPRLDAVSAVELTLDQYRALQAARFPSPPAAPKNQIQRGARQDLLFSDAFTIHPDDLD